MANSFCRVIILVNTELMKLTMPLAWLLSSLGLGLNGIWSAVLVSHVVAAVAAGLIGIYELRTQQKIGINKG